MQIIQDKCIGPKCAAFAQGIQLFINVTPLLSKLKYVFDEDIPLMLYLDIFHCTKYNKFLDKESLDIFKSINLDFEGEKDELMDRD